MAPQCEIHVFDHVDYSNQVPKDVLTFHHVGIKGTNGFIVLDPASRDGINFQSLSEMAKSLGHEKIDILRLDCETCEYGHYSDIGKLDARQLIIMLHDMHHIGNRASRSGGKTTLMLEYLHDLGYVIFHKESNLAEQARYMELSFLKLDPSFHDMPSST